MTKPLVFYLGCLVTGVMVGLGIPLAHSADAHRPVPKSKSNVVVLRPEKTVTLEKPNVTLVDIAAACGKQTGYSFTLDRRYVQQKETYAILVRNVPFSRLLVVSGYLSGGVWERRQRNYHLRPRTPEEEILDTAHYEGLTSEVYEYLKDVDWKDPSLPDEMRLSLGNFKSEFQKDTPDFPVFEDDSMGNWSVSTGPNRIAITYQENSSTPTSASGSVKSRFWGWSEPRRIP